MSESRFKRKKKVQLGKGRITDSTKDVAPKEDNAIKSITTGADASRNFIRVAVVDLSPRPDNTRLFSESEIEELASNIEDIGLKQPIVIKETKGEEKPYQIIVGHRRWRAFQSLLESGNTAFATIPAIVEDVNLSELKERKAWVTTNTLIRTDYSLSERLALIAEAEEIVEIERKEGLVESGTRTVDLVAGLLGISKGSVISYKKLNDLIEPYKEKFDQGYITLKSATEIAALSEKEQLAIHEKSAGITDGEKISAKEMESIVKSVGVKKSRPKKTVLQTAKKLQQDAAKLEKLCATSEQKDIDKAWECFLAAQESLSKILGDKK